MGIGNPFKFERLKIAAYTDRDRKNDAAPELFEAMFNPESFKRTFKTVFADAQSIGSSGKEAKFARNDPSDLNLELTLDGTGASEMGLTTFFSPKPVADRVDDFLNTCYRINGKVHEPNFLIVSWGVLNFECRLKSVDINYTSFDKDGQPLRAVLSIILVSDDELKKRLSRENRQSPDVTHTHVVKSSDTLPSLSKKIYGSPNYYLLIAKYNSLNHFRSLQAGQTLHLPPLEVLID